jgi:protein SCO1
MLKLPRLLSAPSARLLLQAVAALLLVPALVIATPQKHADHLGHGTAAAHEIPADHSQHAAAADQPGMGLSERLGQKIPLDLVFVDEEGQKRRLGDLITGPTIILPVYYRCTNVCNFLQGGLATVLPELKPKPAVDYRVLSISFDERETPADAAKSKRMYMDVIKTPFPKDGWHFLTGDAVTIRKFTDSAGYEFQRKGQDFLHPVVSLVVSGDGKIIRYLYGTNFLSKDVTLALAEAKEGKSGATIRKMVSYCFTFDPTKKSYQFNLLRVSATVIILSTGSFLLYLVFFGRRKD